MNDAAFQLADEPRAEAIIAGTLCLMSCYVQHPVPLYAERVADNLNRMAGGGGADAGIARDLPAPGRTLGCDPPGGRPARGAR